jgi:hypothetical protein
MRWNTVNTVAATVLPMQLLRSTGRLRPFKAQPLNLNDPVTGPMEEKLNSAPGGVSLSVQYVYRGEQTAADAPGTDYFFILHTSQTVIPSCRFELPSPR